MIPLFSSIKQKKFPFITYCLLILNIIVFYYEGIASHDGNIEKMILHYGVIPKMLIQTPDLQWPTLISSQFFHGGWLHLIGNMLYLLIFGRNIEDSYGHLSFITFYLVGGVIGALTQVYFNPASTIPMIGASGAVSGILGSYFMIHPKAKIHTLIPLWIFSRIIRFPAFIFLGIWFIIQAYSGASATYVANSSGQDVGGVAWMAHSGGFIFGVIIALIYRIKRAF